MGRMLSDYVNPATIAHGWHRVSVPDLYRRRMTGKTGKRQDEITRQLLKLMQAMEEYGIESAAKRFPDPPGCYRLAERVLGRINRVAADHRLPYWSRIRGDLVIIVKEER